MAPAEKKVAPADLLFINGNIYTVSGKQAHAEAEAEMDLCREYRATKR